MFVMMQLYAASQLSAMDKMWISFIGIGLMVLAAGLITFARLKTRGWVKAVLSIIAVIVLIYGLLSGIISIL